MRILLLQRTTDLIQCSSSYNFLKYIKYYDFSYGVRGINYLTNIYQIENFVTKDR